MSGARFRMGRLDHVHIRVPDRQEAARWQYELNCCDYERVKSELIEADGVQPVRYWPRELYTGYQNG